MNNLILRGEEAEEKIRQLIEQWDKEYDSGDSFDFVDYLKNNDVRFIISPKIKPLKEWTIAGTDDNYVVRKFNSGLYTCECPLFESGRNKVCHHIKTAVIRLTDERCGYVFNPGQVIPIVVNRDGNIFVMYNKRNLSQFTVFDDRDSTALFLLLRHGWSISELKKECVLGCTSSGLFNDIIKYAGMNNVVDVCFLEDDEDGNGLKRHRSKWTIQDIKILERMFIDNKTIKEISLTLERTKIAIRLKLQSCGYSEEEIFSRNK